MGGLRAGRFWRRASRLAALARRGALTALCFGPAALLPIPVQGQDGGGGVFDRLEGRWVGRGTLMGRPAVFEMRWEAVGGFVRLSFSNGFVGDGGETHPLLSAEATYRAQSDGAVGVWVDTRPQRIRLTATLSDSSVVTDWVADAEAGRTEYIVVGADDVVVRDFVRVDGELRAFGEARYRRGAG